MVRDSFANRFQLALDNLHLKQVDICEKTGLSSSLINKYITGKAIPRQKKVYLLARALNVNPAWLMGFDVSSAPVPEHLTKKDMEDIKNNSKSMSLDEKEETMLNYMNENNIESLFAIPLYNKIDQTIDNSEKNIEGYIPVSPLIYNMENPNNYFYLKISDESMNQKYQLGDYVLMKKNNTIINDSISLVVLEGKVVIRKINCQDNLVLLEPLSNNGNYKIQACSKSDINVLGLAIGYIGYEKNKEE